MDTILNKLNQLNEFTHARITLTLWYIAISIFLMIVFNYAALNAQNRALITPTPTTFLFEIPYTTQPPDMVFQYQQNQRGNVQVISLTEVRRNFKWRLLTFEIAVLTLIAILGYFLSSITLTPIARAMKEQEQFAADASHELRTPLSVINMEIEASKRTEKNIPDTYKQTLNNIQEEVTRMTGIVSGLLTLVRAEQEKASLPKEKVNLTELVQKTTQQMEKLFLEKSYKIELNNTKNLFINAQKDHIKQVILILLDNALKYAQKDNAIIQITLTKEKNNAILEIVDNGKGIDKKHLEHIFERFYKVENSSDGTGLGLAIAKQIIQNHNGDINIKSSIGKGAKIRITLPIYS